MDRNHVLVVEFLLHLEDMQQFMPNNVETVFVIGSLSSKCDKVFLMQRLT